MNPKVCVPKLLSEEQKIAAQTAAILENPSNFIHHEDDPSGRTLALEVGRKWANERTLHVRFLNGDAVQQQKCEAQAHKWEAYANIFFVFDKSPTAEIRVSFFDNMKFNDQGSWSYVGTDCLVAPQTEPTLNLGWLDRNTDDAEWERVVVHEFGHTLGAIHEDQSPSENIKWNTKAVYAYFEGPPNNWSRQDVDDNVLTPTPKNGIEDTVFDPHSIMAYAIPPEFTLDGKGVTGGNKLSNYDKAFVLDMYPLPNTLIPGQSFINEASGPKVLLMPVILEGTYRVWTSFLGGNVTISNSVMKQAANGVQEVTFYATPGIYTVSVSTAPTGYRIVTRKIS
jgi:serralysin